MEWKKSKLTRWTCGDFIITELSHGDDGRPYQLDGPADDRTEFFRTLREAQRSAELRNELTLLQADNARLRMELDERRQAEAFERQAAQASNRGHDGFDDLDQMIEERQAAEAAEAALDAEEFPEDDGRGIPVMPIRESVPA